MEGGSSHEKNSFFILCFSLIILSGCSTQCKRISYDQTSLGETLEQFIDENTKVVNSATEKIPAQLPIYEISERDISKSEYTKTLQALGFPESVSGPGQYIEHEGHEFRASLASYTDTSRSYFNMTDEELEKAAWAIFEKLPFIEGEYEYWEKRYFADYPHNTLQ